VRGASRRGFFTGREERLHVASRVVIVGFEQAQLLDIACPADTFDIATMVCPAADYRVEVASLGGAIFRTFCGIRVAPDLVLEEVDGPIDTLIVTGGHPSAVLQVGPAVLAEVARLAGCSRRVMSVCAGAHILAAAGLLDGRRATTHWSLAGQLAESFPAVDVDRLQPIYVRDGKFHTCSGIMSSVDLTLSLIEADHGGRVMGEVARAMVTYMRRPGFHGQVSVYVADGAPTDRDIVRAATDYITANIDGSLNVAQIGRAIAVSPRHLSRLFLRELGKTPARHVRELRAEGAATMLATTTWPVSSIAVRCGFGSSENLRLAFEQFYGKTPTNYRREHAASGPVRSVS
ncbi:MAG: AraC family transcriptional regulator, partial [Pseudonocardiales bacterium]|nr:AraC family transcriptional regulator [Pseudonocardiales bacterium]